MVWTDDIASPRDELLDRVVRRGDQLRNRRRVALAAALPVLLAAVLLPAALRGGNDPGTRVAASAPTVTGPAATVALAVTPSAPSSETASEQPTTSLTPPTTGAPTVPVPTTARPVPVPTTPTTAIPVEPPTTVPPTTVAPNQPPGPYCNPPKMTSSASTDKPSYRAGEVVQATATWTNTSGETCWYKTGYWGNWVVDATGKVVTPQAWPPFDHGEWRPFRPGETASRGWTWDLTVCSLNNTTACQSAPPGTYQIIFDYEPFAEPTVTIQVVAG